MPVAIPHDEFLGSYYKKAWKFAEITIASVNQTKGPIAGSIDIESVMAEGVLAGLERTYENFNPLHGAGAKIETLLSKVVHNCVLTELDKATRAAKKAGLISSRPKKVKMTKEDEEKELERISRVIPGVGTQGKKGHPFEPHDYMETDGWQERKEKLLAKLAKNMKRLPVNDQIILSFWASDESTYVEKSLEEIGIEKTSATANWVYGRKNKALKALAQMMGKKPDYRDIYLPSAGRDANNSVYTDRNELRRCQYAAKANVTRKINYKKTAELLNGKYFNYL